MDRRNWPWRKKSSDKNAAAPDLSDALPAHSSRTFEEQEMLGGTTDHIRLPQGEIDSQLVEEQARNFKEKLLAALSELSANDVVVKQHVKVAEEAVSGWEKAEADAAAFKQKLDHSQQEKLALEDRVSHLNGALKECMRQIRMVREEQEQSIHEALEKKNRDSEKVRLELEAKLADMSQQLIELVAEKSAFGKALKERAKSVSELTDAKSRAESELQVLQIRVNLLEKEDSSLRYELHLSNKEVEIRNDEREYTRKAAESAHKQHLEDTKKVAKLEAECQRLRVLVKKKLPGPAALAQMRLEVEATGKDSVERKKKSLGKVGGPPRSTTLDALEEGSQTGSNDSEMLSEKLVAMQEETKMLKEALKNKTDELQEAKLMCANTASKLSKVEQQLDAFFHAKVVPAGTLATSVAHIESTSKQNKTPSLVSISGESCNGAEVHCSDVWASTLIAELENFKTDIGSSDKPLESADLDLMDDFIEMERLASTMFPSTPDTETSDSDSGQAGSHITPTTSDENRDGELSALSQTLATRDRELQAANQLALELACKLKISEEQLSVLHSNNSANDEIILHLREKINTLITNQGENAHTKNILKEGMVVAQNDVTEMQVPAEPVPNELIFLSEGSSRSSQLQLQPPCSSSEDSNSEADANTSIPNCDTKAKLVDAVCKLIHLVELIAHQTGFQHTHGNEVENGKLSRLPNMQDCNFSGGQVVPEMKWNHPTIENSICKLVCYGNDFVQGKVDSLKFIAELSSALDCILGLGLSNSARGMANVTPEEKLARSVESIIESTQPHTKLLSNVFSEDIEEETKNVLVPVPSAAGKSDSPGFPNLADENNVSHSHKANPDFQVRAEFDRFSSLEEDLAKLKIEKAEMEQKLEVANARVERLRIQVSDAEQLVSNLRVQLASTHELKQLAEDGLEIVACSKAQLESHVKVADAEVTQWQERVAVLHVEVEEERQQYQDALARLKSLRQQLSAGVSVDEILAQFPLEGNENLLRSSDKENRLRKEREIAEAAQKLVECQRTIFALGRQLKVLASPANGESIDSVAAAEVNADIDLLYSSNEEIQAIVGSTQVEAQRLSAHEKHKKNQEFSRSSPKPLELEPVHRTGGVQMAKDSDLCRSSVFLSSDSDLRGSMHMSRRNFPSSPSPGRSPLMFRPSKSKTLNAMADLSKSLNAADSPSEKLSNSGFARFFSRTKSSHG